MSSDYDLSDDDQEFYDDMDEDNEDVIDEDEGKRPAPCRVPASS